MPIIPPLVDNPAGGGNVVIAAYRPITFTVITQDTTGIIAPKVAYCDIYTNAALFETIRSNNPILVSGNIAIFEFDIQYVIQKIVAWQDYFMLPIAGTGIYLHTNHSAACTIKFRNSKTNTTTAPGTTEPEINTPNGYTAPLGDTTRFANVTRQHEGANIWTIKEVERMRNNDFGTNIWWTFRGNRIKICKNNTDYLYFFIKPGMSVPTGIFYDFRNKAGIQVAAHTTGIALPGPDQYATFAIGTGTSNIDNYGFGGGGGVIDWAIINHYYITLTSGGINMGNSIRYDVGCCCSAQNIRIAFMNYLGTFEYINFGCEVQTYFDCQSEAAQRTHTPQGYKQANPISNTYNNFDRLKSGTIRTNTIGKKTYKATTSCLTEADMKFWAFQLLDTQSAYLEWREMNKYGIPINTSESSWIPIVIKDANVMLSSTGEDQNFVNFTIEFEMSNQTVRQTGA